MKKSNKKVEKKEMGKMKTKKVEKKEMGKMKTKKVEKKEIGGKKSGKGNKKGISGIRHHVRRIKEKVKPHHKKYLFGIGIILFFVLVIVILRFVSAATPTINSAILNSSSGTNYSTENLSVWIDSSNSNTDITDWRLSGNSIAVLNMPFDTNDASTAKDYSSYGNNGSVSGATWTSSGKIGGAYDFEASNGEYIEVAHSSSLDVADTDEVTICLWTKPESFSYDRGTLLTKRASYYTNVLTTGKVSIYTYHDGGGSSYMDSTTSMTAGNWYHICWSENSTGYRKIYFDGDVDAEGSYEASIFESTADQPVSIGRYDSTSTRRYDGLIGDIYVFDKALSAEQINSIYQDGLANRSMETWVSQETSAGENYTVMATPNNGTEDGTSVESNWLEIESGDFLEITDPTSSDPLSVQGGDNISAYFNFVDDLSNVTSGVSIEEVWVGDVKSNISSSGSLESISVIDYEDFSSDFGNWVQATFDTDDWSRGTSTPSGGTGPQSSYDGTFAYVETSSVCNDPDTAVLYQSPLIDFDNYNSVNISFAYNMYGSSMGTLHIKENSTGSWVSKWSETGDQGTSWFTENLKLGGLSGEGAIAIWMDCGISYTSDAAVDSVNVTGTSFSEQLAYVSGQGWQVNFTAPSGLYGSQDLFINASYDGSYMDDLESNALSYPSYCSSLSGKKFEVKNSEGDTCFEVNESGFANFYGDVNESCTAEPSANDKVFRFDDVSSGNPLFWINSSNCFACIKGSLVEGQTLTYNDSEYGQYFIMDKSENGLAKVASNGNLFFKQSACYDSMCFSGGISCLANAQCCSGNCVSGACTAEDGNCSGLSDGVVCSSHCTCSSGVCDNCPKTETTISCYNCDSSPPSSTGSTLCSNGGYDGCSKVPVHLVSDCGDTSTSYYLCSNTLSNICDYGSGPPVSLSVNCYDWDNNYY